MYLRYNVQLKLVFLLVIYKITNLINGKCYVGQTQKEPEERWKEHIYDSKIKDFALYRAIRKYGIENFKFETIEKVDSIEQLNKQEKYWVGIFDSYRNGYNETLGGEDNPMNHAEIREKVRKSKIGNKNWLGKRHTEETKEKMSALRIGHKMSNESRKKLSNTRKRLKMGAKKGADLPNSKKVAQIDPKTNKIIFIYATISDAEKHFAGKTTGIIHRVLNHNYKNKTAYGFRWKLCA